MIIPPASRDFIYIFVVCCRVIQLLVLFITACFCTNQQQKSNVKKIQATFFSKKKKKIKSVRYIIIISSFGRGTL